MHYTFLYVVLIVATAFLRQSCAARCLDTELRPLYVADQESGFIKADSLGIVHPLVDFEDDIENRNWDKIFKDIEATKKLFPSDDAADFYLMRTYFEQGETDLFINLLSQLAVTYPDDEDINGYVQQFSARYPQQLLDAVSRNVNEIAPCEEERKSRALFIVAELLSVNGRFRDSLELLRSLQERYPNLEDLKWKVVHSYLGSDQDEKAFDALQVFDDDEDVTDSYGYILSRSTILRRLHGPQAAIDYMMETWIYDRYDCYDCNTQDFLMTSHLLNGEYDKVIDMTTVLVDSIQRIFDDVANPFGYTHYDSLKSMEAYMLFRRGEAAWFAGRTEEFVDDLRILAAPEQKTVNFGIYCMAKIILGEHKEVREIIESDSSHCNEAFLASCYAMMGDIDTAFLYLEKAYRNFKYTPQRSKTDIQHKTLVANPRFAEVCRAFAPQI